MSASIQVSAAEDVPEKLMPMVEPDGVGTEQPAHALNQIRVRSLHQMGMDEDIAFLSNDKDLKVRARELLEQCFARETDGKLHQWLAGTLEVMGLRKFGISENPFAET